MAKIYLNSALNLVASSASGPEHGLFSRDSPEGLMHSDEIPLFRHGVLKLEATRLDGGYHSAYLQVVNRPNLHAALENRSWYLQEQLLAPRAVYFTTSDICWVCDQGGACYTNQSPVCMGTWADSLKHNLRILIRLNRLDRWLWNRILERYSRTLLTKPTDKLPALAGIMSIFAKMGPQRRLTYVTGLWQEDSEPVSLWRAGYGKGALRPPIARCPSWSWAALGGQMDFLFEKAALIGTTRGIVARVHGTSQILISPDEISAMEYLTIEGPLLDIHVPLGLESSLFTTIDISLGDGVTTVATLDPTKRQCCDSDHVCYYTIPQRLEQETGTLVNVHTLQGVMSAQGTYTANSLWRLFWPDGRQYPTVEMSERWWESSEQVP